MFTRSKVVSQPDFSACPVIRDSNSALWKPGEQSRKPASQVGQHNQPANNMLAAVLHLQLCCFGAERICKCC